MNKVSRACDGTVGNKMKTWHHDALIIFVLHIKGSCTFLAVNIQLQNHKPDLILSNVVHLHII